MLKPEPTVESYRRFARLRIDAVNRALAGILEKALVAIREKPGGMAGDYREAVVRPRCQPDAPRPRKVTPPPTNRQRLASRAWAARRTFSRALICGKSAVS